MLLPLLSLLYTFKNSSEFYEISFDLDLSLENQWIIANNGCSFKFQILLLFHSIIYDAKHDVGE